MWRWRRAAVATMAVLWACAAGRAADIPSAVPVRLVDGRVVVRGAVKTAGGSVAANFVLDLGTGDGLTLPENRAREMGSEAGKPVSVKLEGMELNDVIISESTRAQMVRELTTQHATELEQIPVVGILGLGAFGRQAIELDVIGRTLRVAPESRDTGGAKAEAARVELVNGSDPLFVIAGTKVGIDMLRPESQVSAGAVARLKVGQADAVKLPLGPVDLLRADAFRPSDIKADLLLGVKFLSHFRVTLDQERRIGVFEQLRVPEGVAGEQDYFLAAARRDAAAIAAFIAKNPDHRLVSEAATVLLELRAGESGADTSAVTEAARLLAGAFPVERRSGRLVAIVDDLLATGDGRYMKTARSVLDVAAESAIADLDAKAVYEIHARRGLIALRSGDLDEARRRLISAAYGLPKDPRVNVWMGDLYLRSGQPTRSWPRYVDAALATDPPATALRALDALNRDETFRRSLGTGEMELLLEGRVPAFAPPGVWIASDGRRPHAALVELFVGDAGSGSVGPQLAFDGLRRFYRDTPVTFLAYHFGPAGNTGLSARRAKECGVTSLPAIVVDGKVIAQAAGGVEDAPRLFEEYLRDISEAGGTPSTAPSLPRVAVSVERFRAIDENVAATVRVKVDGKLPEGTQLWGQTILYERRVFAIGGSGAAMHYMVARLVPDGNETRILNTAAGGQAWDVSVSAAELRRAVTEQGERGREASAFLQGAASMRTTVPDPLECGMAVVVRDKATSRVLATANTESGMTAGDRP